MTAQTMQTVSSLHVIYDADGTRTGELIYLVKKLLGIAHCAACDITHGPRKEKPEFTHLKTSAWSVPLFNIHRDEMDEDMNACVRGVLPCVVARTPDEDVLLVRPDELELCGGEVLSFEEAVNSAAERADLILPTNVCSIPRRMQTISQSQLPQSGLSVKREEMSKKMESDDAVPHFDHPLGTLFYHLKVIAATTAAYSLPLLQRVD